MSYEKWQVPEDTKDIILKAKSVFIPESREELIEKSMGGANSVFDVVFEVEGKGLVKEAFLSKCRNGVAANYYDQYMRRRDPDCTVVADNGITDKRRFSEKYGFDFSSLRKDTGNWLSANNLIVMPFKTGKGDVSYDSLFIGPSNCAFFALALADLQTLIPASKAGVEFKPRIIIYLAPVFRHTVFKGKQAVVHERSDDVYEIFSYNLYPGPSAKKGIYGALLEIGAKEGWLTLHSSSVKMNTPYDNSVVILHEGASGGGKSEMNEYMEHSENNKMIIGENIITKKALEFPLINECVLNSVSDDMTLVHPSFMDGTKKMRVCDAESAWFVRVNHMNHYGVNPHFEKMCIHAAEPLIFLNISGVAGSTCLLWEHIPDDNGKPCPNPRVIFPRRMVPGVIEGPVSVDYRSFGVRTPPCSKEAPSFGIVGYFHILPAALAWLWRLAAPRGHENPSIIETAGMTSEGVGSYGPFLTGDIIRHADLLLEQFVKYEETCNVLFPNQYVGVWKTGFMPQWFVREYLARRGGRRFSENEMHESKCTLLGYVSNELKVEGLQVPDYMLDVWMQPEVGQEAFSAGSRIFYDFFDRELKKFSAPRLSVLGKKILQCHYDRGEIRDFKKIFGG